MHTTRGLCLLVVLVSGCSASVAGQPGACQSGPCDGAGGLGVDAGQPPAADLSGTATFQFIFNTLVMPSLRQGAPSFKYDVDGTGKARNQLASVMDTLAAFGAQPQPTVDSALKSGTLIELLQLSATDPQLHNDSSVVVSGWVGDSATAPKQLFDGQATVSVLENEEPDAHRLEGAIASGQLDTARRPPGAMPLHLPLPGQTPLPLTIYAAHVSARVVPGNAFGTGLGDPHDPTAAAIHGGISAQQIHERLVPAVATLLQSYVALGGQVAVLLLAYFDLDGDRVISPAEVESNATVATLLTPDLDLFDGAGNLAPNSDHVKDALSFGAGFTAVPVHFPPQQ